jgi:hypothetical protein
LELSGLMGATGPSALHHRCRSPQPAQPQQRGSCRPPRRPVPAPTALCRGTFAPRQRCEQHQHARKSPCVVRSSPALDARMARPVPPTRALVHTERQHTHAVRATRLISQHALSHPL